MRILVFVKQVPDTDDVALDPRTGNLRREGVRSMLNPLDANAVEAALQLRALHGGTVAVISMGPPQSEEALKKALGMGCDEAYLLSDRAFGGADTLATSYTLAMAARKLGDWDLLLFGRCATDGDTAQTGPATAAQLGIPQITLASSIELRDGWVYCRRALGERYQLVRAKLPAAVTVCGEINKPRYATPINIMKAQKKPRTVWSAEELCSDRERTGAAGSPSCTKSVFEPERRHADTVYFTGSAEEMARAMAELLRAERPICGG